ncbi:efflux transporter outer membrane subunit [Aquabacterium sp. A7-Y]|uniref:efflux transporter outer membrane subunit n=1 Tax=Aquabacterium sp. A7-Y TaxID=1349605 RepID=UPI00223DB65D|nr:efflux transporter outer membrane subunit [Aquabacterium sp. A7-Y]MCW7541054.1 efflux transporter outer membrane subunit [Aquabacterium sp. A7-Y]
MKTDPPAFRRRPPRPAACLAAVAVLLGACVSSPPATPPMETAAPQWSAALPHGGRSEALSDWWRQFDDPELAALIDAAQSAHPSLTQAAARIRQARAQARAAGAASWPALDARAGVTRSSTELPPQPGVQTSGSASLDALWEIDLFGVTRHTAAAARARAAGSEAAWHEARVSLAAEVANVYVALRACEAGVAVLEQDAQSLREAARLTRQKVEAGFEAPANGSLAQASAAESASRLAAQQADCEVLVKQLVALTVLPEPALRERLAAGRGRLPTPAQFEVEAVPARVLRQRPDLAAAESELAAAASEVGAAQADRYPRLSLSGSIGRAGVRVGGETVDGRTWSIGPSLVLPLFDAGRRGAAVDAARGRYDEAVAAWQERALSAVREVEEALVRLDAAQRREADAAQAAQGYAEFLRAAQTQYRVGTGSLLDLEQARRQALAADAALIQVKRERVAAWLALYKAVGGGWQRAEAEQAGAAAATVSASASAPPQAPATR